MDSVKKALYKQCAVFLENRLKTIQHTIKGIQESLLSETKSSAGDKHETGRAMLQLEREKAGNQLAEIQKIKEAFSKIDISKKSKKVSLGNIVITPKINYFISISAGELVYDDKIYYAISSQTPIGKLLLSKHVGDEVVFRTNTIKIINIL